MVEHRATIEVIQGDITTMPVDAIVNAANSALAAGGGVCGAIFSSAGNGALTASCREIGGCPTGSAVVTPSHNLQSVGISHIIHAVGPIWDPGAPEECDRLLAGAYRSSLQVAESVNCRSIAFPSISTGIFGFPAERAAQIAVNEARQHRGALERIVLVAFDAHNKSILDKAVAN
jgi:O-acetyl-ADP-ribose deacetylase